MITMYRLPRCVTEYFSSVGADMSAAEFVMRSDLGSDSVRKDVFAVISGGRLYVAEGSVEITGGSITVSGQKQREEAFKVSRHAEFLLSELTDFRSEQLISTGRVVAKRGDGFVSIICFSNTFRHDASVLVRACEEYKQNGCLDENKYKKDDHSNLYCPKCGRRYPSVNNKNCPNCMDKIKLVKKLGGLFMRYKGYILIIIFHLAMISAITAFIPQISNVQFYRELQSPEGTFAGLCGIVLTMLGINVLLLVIRLISNTISAKVAADVTYDLKREIFSAISRLSLSFFTNRQTGGLMTQINSDSNTIYWFFCDGFPYFVLNIVQIVVVFVIMLLTNWVLALYAFITAPIFVLVLKSVFATFDKLHAKNYSRRRSLNSLISDVLNGMRVVKVFSREEDEKKRFDKRSNDLAETTIEINTRASRMFPYLFFLSKIGSYIVWALGGMQVMAHNGGGTGMDYGTLMAFVAYFNLVFGPLDVLADVANWWSECMNALQRMLQITEAVPEVVDSENPVDMSGMRGDVEFRNVKFSYDENRRIIDGISFSVDAGHTLGIVGHTGAGKSTLVNLLCRLYDVESGEILIDGVNIKNISMASLRRNMAIVSQETYLFRGTILENIRYACPEATNEEVVAAAKMAGAHSFIMRYPDGYETQIGFGKKELSGGERQRVSIARAILKNPKILILDEATAAMDTQTERQITSALSKLTEGRTTIIIAHRLSTLRDADELIVIENGRMPERGTVKQLLEKNGVYAKLYRMQTEALKVIGIADDFGPAPAEAKPQ